MSFCQEPKVDCQYLKSVIKNLNTRLHILENTNQNCELKNNEVMEQITEDLVIPKLKLNKIQIGFIENNVPQKKVLVTFGNKENFRMDNCDQVGDRIDQNILAKLLFSIKLIHYLINHINQPSPQKKIISQSLLVSQQLQILKQKDNKFNNINKQPKLKLVKQDSNLIHPIFSKKNSDQQSLGTKFYTRNNSIQSTPVKQIAYNSSLGTTPLRRKNSQKNSDVFINSLQIDDTMHNQSKFLKYFQQNYGSNKQCNTFDNATINLQRRTSLKSQNKITLVDAQIINI